MGSDQEGERFRFSIANISDVSIDMSRIVKNDPVKYANYKEAYEGMSFMSVLKSK